MRVLLAILVLLTTLPCDGQVRRRVLMPKPSAGGDPYHQGTNQLTYTNNLLFWAMGNAGTWTNSAGTSNALNGDRVWRWLDLSTNKQDLLATGASTRAKLSTNTPSGYPEIILVYSVALMTNFFGWTNPQPMTCFYVCNPTNAAPTTGLDGVSPPAFAFEFRNDSGQHKYGMRAGSVAEDGVYAWDTRVLVSMLWSNTSSWLRVNGVASGNTSPGSNGKYGVGLGNYPASWEGAVSEILIFAENMATNNLQTVERYLAYKYQLYVP